MKTLHSTLIPQLQTGQRADAVVVMCGLNDWKVALLKGQTPTQVAMPLSDGIVFLILYLSSDKSWSPWHWSCTRSLEASATLCSLPSLSIGPLPSLSPCVPSSCNSAMHGTHRSVCSLMSRSR